MPDLDRTAVMHWIAACELAPAQGWITPIRAIEDSDAALEALVELGHSLDQAAQADGWMSGIPGAEPCSDLHVVITQLGAGRMLRLIRWLSSESGKDGELVLHGLLAGRFGPADGLRQTIQSLHRQALLARIFDETRLRALLAASKTVKEGAAA